MGPARVVWCLINEVRERGSSQDSYNMTPPRKIDR